MRCEQARIIVVDDVNAMRVQVREMLKNMGFEQVAIAQNGEEAKRLMENERFDLVIADWQMEPTNGIELLKYLRAHPQYSKIPFAMLTAESVKEKVVEAVQAGIDDYLVKPVTPIQVQNKVLALLMRKGGFQ